MSRVLSILAIVISLSPTIARAGGLCIKLSWSGNDYTLVLDKVPKNPTSLAGYSARYDGPGYEIRPVSGTGYVVPGPNVLVLSVTEYGNLAESNGIGFFTTPNFVSLRCPLGTNGKLGLGDTCAGQLTSGGFTAFLEFGQVVACNNPAAAPPLP
jgi:hypothetical protein